MHTNPKLKVHTYIHTSTHNYTDTLSHKLNTFNGQNCTKTTLGSVIHQLKASFLV